jgi:hypothetical protein
MNNKMLHGPDITEKIVYDYMKCSPIKEQLLYVGTIESSRRRSVG